MLDHWCIAILACIHNVKYQKFNIHQKLYKFLKGYEKNLKQYIGHGDLCFNNILVDQISGCIKLIDPKAYWDKKRNIFGLVDPNYDLAKLNGGLYNSYKNIRHSTLEGLNTLCTNTFYEPIKVQILV